MKKLELVAFLFATLLPVGNSKAMDVTLYEKVRSQPASTDAAKLLAIQVGAQSEAYEWTNALLEHQSRALFYCTPRNLVLNTENHLQFIDEALQMNRDGYIKAKTPVALILLQMLQYKFPCRDQKQ